MRRKRSVTHKTSLAVASGLCLVLLVSISGCAQPSLFQAGGAGVSASTMQIDHNQGTERSDGTSQQGTSAFTSNKSANTSAQDDSQTAAAGNRPENYADGAYCVSDEDGQYDYFYSVTNQGISRAATDGSSVDVIAHTGDGLHDAVSFLSLDGDRLFYLLKVYDGDAPNYEVHAVNTDGSSDQVVYSLSSSDQSESIGGVYLYDHTLYLLVEHGGTKSTPSTYEVRTIKEDGSDLQVLGSDLAKGAEYLYLTEDHLYYTVAAAAGDGKLGELHSQKVDGSRDQTIYTSTLGYLSCPVVLQQDLYVTECGSGGNQLTCMGLDGSGVQSRFHSDDSGMLKIASITGKRAVMLEDIGQYDSYFGDLVIADFDSDSTRHVWLPQSYTSHNIEIAGDHLLDFCNGVPDTGIIVYSLSCEDDYVKKLHDYANSANLGEGVPKNPDTCDFTKGGVTELTGTLRAHYVEFGAWGATEYVLELPSPMAVVYENGAGGTDNRIVDLVQVSSAENYLAMGETEHKTDPSWEKYVGKVVTISFSEAWDAGTAHFVYPPALMDPKVTAVYGQ